MVLTRSQSQMSEMQSVVASGTCGANTSTAVTTTVSNLGLPTITTATYTTTENPIVSTIQHDVSLSSDSAEQTIISPDFQSQVAQSIRRELREGASFSPAREISQSEDIQQVVQASVGLVESRILRQMDDKIQQALSEIKQALGAQNCRQQPVENAGSSSNASNLPPRSVNQPASTFSQPPVGLRPPAVTGAPNFQTESNIPSQTLGPLPPLRAAPGYTGAVHGNTMSHLMAEPPQEAVNQTSTPQPRPYGSGPQNPQASFPNAPNSNTWQQQNFPGYNQQPQFYYNEPQIVPPQNMRYPVSQPAVQVNHMPPQQYRYTNMPMPYNGQVGYPQDNWSVPSQPHMPQQMHSNYQLAMNRPNPSTQGDPFKLSKWGIKFDGTDKYMNVQEFIFRVNSLRKAYRCSEEELLPSFHLLLEGPAVNWYWDLQKIAPVNSWEELEQALLNQYRGYEEEDEVQVKILTRKQLPHESFEEFFHAVINLRNQQTVPYPEERLVNIMRRNLKPTLMKMLFSVRVKTLSAFCREVRRAEALLISTKQMYPTRPNYTHRVNELEFPDEDSSSEEFEIEELQSTRKYTCWNCKKAGHPFMDCPEPVTRVFCFRCGRENVVAPKCGCQGNRKRHPSRAGETRSTEV